MFGDVQPCHALDVEMFQLLRTFAAPNLELLTCNASLSLECLAPLNGWLSVCLVACRWQWHWYGFTLLPEAAAL